MADGRPSGVDSLSRRRCFAHRNRRPSSLDRGPRLVSASLGKIRGQVSSPESQKRNAHKRARRAWIRANGPVPAGHHIHHRDGNPFNNALENLECIASFAHLSKHGSVSTPARRARGAASVDRLREATIKFRASPQGQEWGKELARRSWAARTREQRSCDRCGGSYETWSGQRARFCSNACKSAWRRAARLDDEDRVCTVCSTDFRVNRYEDTQTCSKACASTISADARRGRPQRRRLQSDR